MDNLGVQGFPMRLAVAFVLIALCAPVLAGAAEGFQEYSDTSGVSSELSRIVSVSDRIYYSGTGASETLELSIRAGYEIVVGGEGADAYSISIMKDGKCVERHRMENPEVRFAGEGLVLSGLCTIRMTCLYDEDGYGIGVDPL